MNKEQQKLYDEFIKNGLASGFTDDQIDFMWEYVLMTALSMVKMKSL